MNFDSNILGKCCSAVFPLLQKSEHILTFIFLLLQGFWSSCQSSFSTSLCWRCCPVTTQYRCTTSCPGPWLVWARQEPSSFLEASSSSSSPFLLVRGRSAGHTRIAPLSLLMQHVQIIFLMFKSKQNITYKVWHHWGWACSRHLSCQISHTRS